MLNFEQVLNFGPILKEQAQTLIHEFIVENNSTNNSFYSDEQYQELLTKHREWKIEPRIVAREISGVILFAWQTPDYRVAKSFIASYETSVNVSKILFYEEKLLHVVNASVNANDTLLAFTTVEKSSKLVRGVSESLETKTFSSYIAEIAPRNRVFSLNVEWNTYQKVQFLKSHTTRPQSVFHLVFCNHKNSIQFYELHVKRVADGSVILTQQPSTKNIAGEFLWSSFDASNQRLYYLQLLPQDEEELEAAAVLTAIDFNGNGGYQYVINFILPIKFKMDLVRANAVYDLDSISKTVSSTTFNMQILTEPRGSLYVCYQQPVTENRYTEDESSGDDLSVISESSASHDSILQTPETANCHVNYTVICVHSAFSAHCSSVIPFKENADYRVHFILFNDYLLVHLPGSFLHFLDISCEHEPAHSLLIRRKHYLPTMPSSHPSAPCFIPYDKEEDRTAHNKGTATSSKERLAAPLLFDTRSGSVYKLELNCVAMYKFFLSSKPQTRLSVLHACFDHFKEYTKLCKKIMTRICQDPAHADSSLVLKELMVLLPYATMKDSVTLLDLKVLPFTTQSCYRGQVERNSSGIRDVYLSYKTFKEDLVRQIKKVLRGSQNTFWKELLKYLTFETDHRNRRVPLSLFYMIGIEAREPVTQSNKTQRTGRRNTSFVFVPRNNSTAGMDRVNVDKLSIDDNILDETQWINDTLNSIATRNIVNYVARHFGQETKPRVEELCAGYMEYRCESINQLWNDILKALDKTDDAVRFCRLSTLPDELEMAIFQLVERVKVICDQLCYPHFFRMEQVLCALSLRCLSTRQFLTYVNARVFRVSMGFVRRAMRDLADSTDTQVLIEGLLACLTKPEAQRLALEWNHPTGNRFLAEYISWKMPFNKINAPPPPPNANSDARFEEQVFPSNKDEFMPLKTLLHAFKVHGKTSNVLGSKNKGEKKQDELLATVGLCETNSLR